MPPNYGALRCNTWDEGLPPSCGDDGGVAVLEPEPWCAASFCYVDPASCDRPSDRSAYTWADPASHAPLGELHYSYETCGNLNSYAESRHYEQLSGMHLRVAFPGDSGAGYTLYTIQHGVDEGKKDGSVWGFMAGVLKEGNVSWTPQEISNASRSRFNSSYSACVHDVALGELDLCIGPFWMTPERLLMAPYTTPLFDDHFQLIVRRTEEDYDGSGVLYVFKQLADNLHMPFRPFTPIAWAFILSTTAFMSTVMARIQQMPATRDDKDAGRNVHACARVCTRMGVHGRTVFVGNGFDRISAELQKTISMVEPINVDRVVNKAAMKFRAAITPPGELRTPGGTGKPKQDIEWARLMQQHMHKKQLIVPASQDKTKSEDEETLLQFLASVGDDASQSAFYGFVGLMSEETCTSRLSFVSVILSRARVLVANAALLRAQRAGPSTISVRAAARAGSSRSASHSSRSSSTLPSRPAPRPSCSRHPHMRP